MAAPVYSEQCDIDVNAASSADRAAPIDLTCTVAAGSTLTLSGHWWQASTGLMTIASVVLDPGGGNETSFTHVPSNPVETEAAANNFIVCDVWTLLSAPAGTFTVRVTTAGTPTAGGDAFVLHEITGVDSIGATNTKSDNTAPATGTIDLATNRAASLALAFFTFRGGDGDPFTPDASDTERTDAASGTNTGTDVGVVVLETPAPTTGTYALTTTPSVLDDWAIVAVELRSAASATPKGLALLGVG